MDTFQLYKKSRQELIQSFPISPTQGKPAPVLIIALCMMCFVFSCYLSCDMSYPYLSADFKHLGSKLQFMLRV